VTYADGPVGLHFAAVSLEQSANAVAPSWWRWAWTPCAAFSGKAGQAALLFAAAAILLLTLGLDFLGRSFVHRPLAAVLRTMARASAGDLAVRTPIVRADEIGLWPKDSTDAGTTGWLQRKAGGPRFDRATAELRAANQELLGNAQRLFRCPSGAGTGTAAGPGRQMAASVAHQTGTPLNVISGYVQMASGEARGWLSRRGAAARHPGADRAVTAIVQSLLDTRGGRPSTFARSRREISSKGSRSWFRPSLVVVASSWSWKWRPAFRR